jgi:murein DD-endopeptidase MepM/ murein hydrolase activator NlpD
VLSVVASGLLATAVVAPAASFGAPTRVVQQESGSQLKGEWDEVLGEESVLLARVERARAEQVRLSAELDALKLQVQAKETELVATQLALQEAEEEADRQAAALKAAERKVSRAKERLRKQIVASYVTGGESSGVLEAMLSAEDTDDAGRAIAYSKAIVGDTEVLLNALAEAREERKAIDRRAKRTAKTALARRDEVRDATSFLAGARDNQQALLDQVDVQVFNEATALRAVQGKKALIEGRINAEMTTSDGVAMILASRQQGQPDWVPGDLVITTPTPGYRIGSSFGPRLHPILNIVRLHAGGDIGAPSGTPIHAPADGVVVLAEVRGGYGNTTVIDHGHSLGTLYAHQSRIVVEPGQIVQRGDLIGFIGSTGLSTGPHLHFETRVRGMPINPAGVVDWDAEVDYGR